MRAITNIKQSYSRYQAMDSKDKKTFWKEGMINNAIYFLLLIVVIYTTVQNPNFIKAPSIVNIISLSAANLPIACGIAGCIVLTGTDLSAGRVVGLTACISASLLTTTFKVFPDMNSAPPIILVILLVIVTGGLVDLVNGFSVAKFKLHPFIVTLSTQLIVYGIILMYLMKGSNNGQTLSGLTDGYRSLITGTLFSIPTATGSVAVPRYVLYSIILVILMWIIWNKTTFGKNMFAVGSNEEAANVSGVNVSKTIMMVFVLAGMMYAITGFLDGARIASANANTGLNYECDAIAACVIGGVSFVGGIGRISGIVVGVLHLLIIFTGLNFLAVDANMLYIIKGLIILIACAIDMRKYLVKK